uniref:F-box domain-containing protein n=1 Tax=Ditylenchus dipsaci TaxID=166011 RepID=A0A915CZL6_9BILA
MIILASDHLKMQTPGLAISGYILHEVFSFLSRRQLQNSKLVSLRLSRYIQDHFPTYPLHCVPGMSTDGQKITVANHPEYEFRGLSQTRGSKTVPVSEILPYIGNLPELGPTFPHLFLAGTLWKQAKLLLRVESLRRDCNDCHQIIKGLCARQLFQSEAVEVRHMCRYQDLWPMLGLLLRTCTSTFDWQFICIKGDEVFRSGTNASLCSDTIQFVIHNKLEWKKRGRVPKLEISPYSTISYTRYLDEIKQHFLQSTQKGRFLIYFHQCYEPIEIFQSFTINNLVTGECLQLSVIQFPPTQCYDLVNEAVVEDTKRRRKGTTARLFYRFECRPL